MSERSFFLASLMMYGVSFMSSAAPSVIGRILVQSAFARSALAIAVVLFGCAIGAACLNQMTRRMALLVAAGVAPLHQLLVLRYLYRRFVERNGRHPQSASRFSPQADRQFASTNLLLGAVPYLLLAFIIAKLGR